MNPHAHIALCDREWNFLYEAISFDTVGSVDKYLNLMFSIFNMNDMPRKAVENVMYDRIDQNSPNPVYFKYDEMVYVWMLCDSCRATSLN